jgi:hypothetical protein
LRHLIFIPASDPARSNQSTVPTAQTFFTMMSYTGSIFGFTDVQDALKNRATDSTSDTSSEHGDDLGLEAQFPSISSSECTRFRKHYENDDECVKRLEELVDFRSMYEIGSPEFNKAVEENDDAADWEWASKTAIQGAKANPELLPGLEGCVSFEERFCNLESIQQNVYAYKNEDGTPARTKDGKPFIQYMSANMDLSETTGASPEVYATALALYLERKAKSVGFDNGIVMLIDTRQGTGWPNHNVLTVIPGIRQMANAIDKLHPGISVTIAVYPVPYACVYVFSMLKSWMPAAIAESELQIVEL